MASSTLPRVVATRLLPGTALDRLAAASDLWLWPERRPLPRPLFLEQVATAAGLLRTGHEAIDAALLDTTPGLRVVSTFSVGLDGIDLAECARRGVLVGHTPDVLTETTADTAFGLLLAAARRFKEGIDLVRRGEWQYNYPDLLLGEEVHSSTIGIVGLGRIGARWPGAPPGSACGSCTTTTGAGRKPAGLGATFRATLSELLADSDHVVLTVPLTPQTHHLIGPESLAAMKPTATLVNACRGPVVDPPAALAAALRAGTITTAALDVTEPEPLPADHPLVGLPNCTIIPHLGSASRATRVAMADLAVANLLAGLAGRPMPACANPEAAAGPPRH